MQALYNVTAGEATLTMDIRDAATGALLGQVVDRGTAHELSPRINRTFGVTNAFWFDALFTSMDGQLLSQRWNPQDSRIEPGASRRVLATVDAKTQLALDRIVPNGLALQPRISRAT